MSRKPIVSYAQNFEDVMLWRALGHVRGGHYVDIGAQDPLVDSVSRLFHEQGWRGVHVDPSSAYSAALREDRPQDEVVEAAVTDADGQVRFFEIAGTGLSTTQADVAEQHIREGFAVEERLVPAVTLDEVLSLSGGPDIHWLKIDVEGAEADVLRSWRGPLRPWVVVVESTRPLSREDNYAQWEPLMFAKGYAFAWFDGLNRYYVLESRAELRSAFGLPPNIFDGFMLSGKASAPFCELVNKERDATLAAAKAREQEVGAWLLDLRRLAEAEREWREAEQAGRQADRAEFSRERETLQAEKGRLEARLGEEAVLMDLRSLVEAERRWREAEQVGRQADRAEFSREREALLAEKVRLEARLQGEAALVDLRSLVEAERRWREAEQVGRQADRAEFSKEREAWLAEKGRLEARLRDEPALLDLRRLAEGERRWREAEQEGRQADRARFAAERDALDAELRAAEVTVQALRSRLASEREAASLREMEIGQGFAAARLELDRLHAESAVVHERLEAALHEAYRWWVEAETLRAQLERMVASHSWRLTSPLRRLRAVASEPIKHLRAGARPLVKRTMRMVVDSPLRRPAQIVLTRLPHVRGHLRAFAVKECVIPGEPAQAGGLVASQPPAEAAVQALTPRLEMSVAARRVHARLFEALGGNRN